MKLIKMTSHDTRYKAPCNTCKKPIAHGKGFVVDPQNPAILTCQHCYKAEPTP